MTLQATLLSQANSPFARKVRIVLHETGLTDRVAVENVEIGLLKKDLAIYDSNPLGQIPTLLLPDGEAIHDSRVIVEYLDSLHDGQPLIPAPGPQRWRVQTLHSLGDALTTLAIGLLREDFSRPEAVRWSDWADGLRRKIDHGVRHIERDWLDHLRSTIDIGTISVAVALSFIQLRADRLKFALDSDGITDWLADFSTRPSMTATAPLK